MFFHHGSGVCEMPIKKILVVDDSATERYFLSELLTKSGFTVQAASDADTALTMVKADPPDLVLMDVLMPGTNGFSTTRAIARDPQTAHVPVILCTSKGGETDRIWGLRQGAVDYVVKPIDPQDLLAKIAAL